MTRAQMRLPADERTVARLKSLVECFCKQHGLPRRVSAVVMLSLDEVVSNILLHGYGRRPGQLSIALHYDGRAFSVVIEDSGKPFDLTKAAAPVNRGKLASRREGGLGLLIVKNLMDEITYKRTGAINRLKLVKRL
jgi:anti-sigma regulatory factor (Ser/Thr protein kinase)